MPRRKSRVKDKTIRSPGAIDVHFHGAFGIDLMTAEADELNLLSRELRAGGVAGFCATTLSVPFAELRESVSRLGRWIRSGSAPGAVPLGIHLEGPYLSPHACGAHAPRAIRPLDLSELEDLREASRDTLRIVTLAPERLSREQLDRVCRWARRHSVRLSLGHSRATQAEASLAFSRGFSGVTHAWNAMSFHHRSPGPMGAALGTPGVHVELIVDGTHVSPTLLGWTCSLHPAEQTCFVSDCVPAAALRPGRGAARREVRFGNLRVHLAPDGACRLPDGTLAGGGLLLPEAFRRWLGTEIRGSEPAMARALLKRRLTGLHEAPLSYLGVQADPRLESPILEWLPAARGLGLRVRRTENRD